MTISINSERDLHETQVTRKHAAKQAKRLRRDLARTTGAIQVVQDRATNEYAEEGRLASLERTASQLRTGLTRAESVVASCDQALVG